MPCTIRLCAVFVLLLGCCQGLFAEAASGLRAIYYDNRDFSGVSQETVDANVDFNWAGGVPRDGIAADTFSIVWWGGLVPTVSGRYTIATLSDDGIEVEIDGRLVISQWNDHASRRDAVEVDLVAGQRHEIVVRYYENGGSAVTRLLWRVPGSLQEVAIPTTALVPGVRAGDSNGTGLAASYYLGETLSGQANEQIDPAIDYDWGGAPFQGIPADHFSAKWEGELIPRYTETYSISVDADDGVLLFIDDRLVIDAWVLQSRTTYRANVTLTAGQRTKIRVHYYECTGRATIRLAWRSPRQAEEVIPRSQLVPLRTPLPTLTGSGTGLTATYHGDEFFAAEALTRIDAKVDFAWGSAGPDPAVGAGGFAVEWKGRIEIPVAGDYRFFTTSADGALLWIDGRLVVDGWGPHGRAIDAGAIQLTAGSHQIVCSSHSRSGGGVARLWWSGPGIPCSIVPQAVLYPQVDGLRLPPDITSPLLSRTSPAWLEGTVDRHAAQVVVRSPGLTLITQRQAPGSWYTTSASSGLPAGIPLAYGQRRPIEVDDGSNVTAAELQWQVTDLTSLPYGSNPMVIRVGDSLLLTASGPGTKLELTVTAPDASQRRFTGLHLAGVFTAALPVPFTVAGNHLVTATIDGHPAGMLTVAVVGADLKGPIACQIGYKRIKDVGTQGAQVGIERIVFTSGDPQRFLVDATGDATATRRLTLRPLSRGFPRLQARLGQDGPLISEQVLDEFTIITTAEKSVVVVETLPDGSLRCRAELEMRPLVPALKVALRVFVAGVTFDDSTISRDVSSDTFYRLLDSDAGRYDYGLIRAPGATVGTCHSFQVFQAGVQVSY